MIRVEGLRKSFGSKKVLQGISMEIDSQEILFVIGKSGTGKSVLLKHIVGLMQPDAGKIWVEDQEVTKLKERELFSIRKRCGMVFQFPALLDSLNVYDNIAFGLRSHKLIEGKKAEKEKVLEKIDLVDLDESVLAKFPPELSYGIQKRVSLARTIAIEPAYLLFDEPTTAQDPVATTVINRLIQKLSDQLKVTCVVVSHDMPSALTIADRVILLDAGKVVDQGTPKQLKQSEVPLTRNFLKESLQA